MADQRWLVVSDLHLDQSAHRASLGQTGYDSDPALVAAAVAAMKAADPNAPVVVIAGDSLAHHFHGDALATMRGIANAFDRAFPRAQFLVTLGNNDDPCGDYAIGTDSSYLKAVAAIWEPLVDRGGASPEFAKSFARGGYYTARLPMPHLRAVVLDSVLWSWLYGDCTHAARSPGADELGWLDATLARGESGSRDVFVMHIPPGLDGHATELAMGVTAVPFFTQAANQGFLATVARHRARIAGMIAGHLHRNDYRLVDGVPMLIASSVSPIAGNRPTFYTLDVRPNGTPGVATPHVLTDGVWMAQAATDFERLASTHARAELTTSRFLWCAETKLDDAYVSCAGIPGRRAIAIAAFAVLIAVLVSLPLLGLLRRRRRTR
jgi:hypothetical protein